MNQLISILAVTLSILYCSSLYAAEDAQSCQVADKTTQVYFGNGVNNTLAEARFSRNALVYAYLVKNDIRSNYPDEKFKFFLAYNYSRGFVKDILEVINQKVDETGGLTATEILFLLKLSKKAALKAITSLSTASGGARIIVDVAARAVDTASDEYIKRLEEDAEGLSRYYQESTTNDHIQKYTSDLNEGKKVIVVAHSQGNLFANAAVTEVINRNSDYVNSIGIVGVASPAGIVIGSNQYITADDDRVIDALRITHTVLPSNIDNDPGFFDDPRDMLNHSFTTSYLASELTTEYTLGESTLSSRAIIDSMFSNLLSTLDYPSSDLGDGAIKVTLEWGSNPDLDLHIFEPNGDHVFYSDLRGASGFLDLDDTTSFGPEHYFVACESIEEGRYVIAVNYFDGSGSETARVQISTADGRTQTVSRLFTTALGRAGDSSPSQVATIDVTKEENGNYKYNVIVQ